jgi:hypothetical protein
MVVCHKNGLSRNENTKTSGQIVQNPQARNSVQPARMRISSGSLIEHGYGKSPFI